MKRSKKIMTSVFFLVLIIAFYMNFNLNDGDFQVIYGEVE